MTEPESTTADIDWRRRALCAEAAVHHALWMSPTTPHMNGRPLETAAGLVQRLRTDIERVWPDLIVRHEHQAVPIFDLAEMCCCDENADGWYDDHHETDDSDNLLCLRTVLGYVCESCTDEEGEGPEWKPYAVRYPCPPVAALGAPNLTPAAASVQDGEAAR